MAPHNAAPPFAASIDADTHHAASTYPANYFAAIQ